MRSRPALLLLGLCGLCSLPALPACSSPDPLGPLGDLPVSEQVGADVSARVDIFRDEYGVPHIYGKTLADAAFGQGYVMAQDRLVQMDLLRHYASGTLAELLGGLDPSFIDQDIAMRTHHLRATAEVVWQQMQASQDPADQALVPVLKSFAAGVNAYLAELKAGDRRLPVAFVLAYDVKQTADWAPVDSLALARLQAFDLSFDADSEIARTQGEAAAALVSGRPGLDRDLYQTGPLDPAFIFVDATQSCGGGPQPSAAPAPVRAAAPRLRDLRGLGASLGGIGLSHRVHDQRGSNNWVVGPALSQSGHAILSNDTHLSLNNPPIFYLSHLHTDDGAQVMGVQFAGLPGVVLGMNDHVAWGATVTAADVTDVYEETIVPCGAGPCVLWRGQMVPLQERVEAIGVGRFGTVKEQRMVTLWDVPHHGPILPRIDGKTHDTLPLGASELSVRYTGHQPTRELRAVLSVNRAGSTKEAMDAIERDFAVGGQNWIFADTAGHIGWTTHVDLPARPPAAVPWLIQPGDGSVDWLPAGVPTESQPRAYEPACGMVATANNDPWGKSAGLGKDLPYHGWDYDPGPRAGRITTRLREEAKTADRLTLVKMQGIQGDNRSFLGSKLAAILVGAADGLAAEIAQPGTSPDLGALAQALDQTQAQAVGAAAERVRGWGFGTPSGLDNEAAQAQESIAATVFQVWLSRFHYLTLGDELGAMDDAAKAAGQDAPPHPGSGYERKLLFFAALSPERLQVGRQANGDSLLFDDLGTPGRTETRREIAARALIEAVAALQAQLGAESGWQWGRVHRLNLDPLLPIDDLKIPSPKDPSFPTGVPRHGDMYSVDVGHFSAHADKPSLLTDYTYSEGPAIRFVAELTESGPVAYNVLPGGQVFDPESPHYADQFELWRKNQAFPLPFSTDAVAASVQREAAAGRPVRVQLVPRKGE